MTLHLLSLSIFLSPLFVRAQAIPDAGRLLQDVRPPALVAPPRTGAPDLSLPKDTPARALEGAQTITVSEFILSGVSALPEADIQAVLMAFKGRSLTFSELAKATQAVAALYRERGYFLARAYLPAQEIRDGRIEIAVLEGRLGKAEVVSVAGAGARVPSRAAQRVLDAQLTTGTALRESDLERALLLISDLPGLTSKAEIAPGARIGETGLRVQLSPMPLFNGSVDIANSGNRYTGEWRVSGNLYANSPLGIGDQFIVNASTSGADFTYGRIAYSLPVAGYGTRLGIAYYALDYALCCQFKPLNAEGVASATQGYLSHPFIRSRDFNLTGRVSYEEKRLSNDSAGLNVSNKRVRNVPLGLSFESRDGWAGGGFWSGNLEYTIGHLDLSRNTGNQAADAATARTEGSFSKTTLQLSRLQQVTSTVLLQGALYMQAANKNLDSSERMSLGGPGGVRAYPVGETVGDEGAILNLEARWEFARNWQLSAFYDLGRVTAFKNFYTGALAPTVPNRYNLSGEGLGLSYIRPNDLVLRVQVARKNGNNPGRDVNGNDADGRHDRTRAWVTVAKYF